MNLSSVNMKALQICLTRKTGTNEYTVSLHTLLYVKGKNVYFRILCICHGCIKIL